MSLSAPDMPSGDVDVSVSAPDMPSVDVKTPKKNLFGKFLKKKPSKASVEVSRHDVLLLYWQKINAGISRAPAHPSILLIVYEAQGVSRFNSLIIYAAQAACFFFFGRHRH